MTWPWVSRAKFEALEDKLDDQMKRYRELQLHADKLLDSLLEHPEKSDEDRKPEKPQLPRRLLNREISAMASQAAEIRYQNSQRKA